MSATVVQESDTALGAAPAKVSFMVFCCVWTLLMLIYLLAIYFYFSDEGIINHPYAVLALDVVTSIFWFAAFVDMAVALEARFACPRLCQELIAATVFGAFEWAIWTVLSVFAGLQFRRARY